MRSRNLAVLISLLVVCFMLAAQSAKAGDIVFNDVTDTISVSPSSSPVTIVTGCQTGVANTDICKIALVRMGLTITSVTGNFTLNPTSTNPVQTSYFLSEDAARTLLSDTFLSIVVAGPIQGSAGFEFDSDIPILEGVPVPCIVGGCNAAETGQPQLVGTITWSDGTIDNIKIQSDVPEPASLVLFGSGLALAGGFLRRRWRLLTPAV